MADWRDVMNARTDSDSLAAQLERIDSEAQASGRDNVHALGYLAIVQELRALATLIDHRSAESNVRV